MKYLSLYKTSFEHSADNSRLVPNISLITDEKKMILTNENNIGTIFENVDIIESFDDIINRFPTGNSTAMPGLKIYGDNTEQSKTKNIKLFNDALQWRSNYLSHNGLSDTGQGIRINVDAVLIDNEVIDRYDSYYHYNIKIYSNHIYLENIVDHLKFLIIFSNGLVNYINYNTFPSPTETGIPGLKIYMDNSDQSKANNIELYNNAQEWRKKYILHNGWSDTGQQIHVDINLLVIDDEIFDEYNANYDYYIDIYNDRIILNKNHYDHPGLLTIFSDGSVNYNYNIFPSTTNSYMPGVKIYTDNTDQSKEENIKLYNNAQEYRVNVIKEETNTSTPEPSIIISIDKLVIDDVTLDEFNRFVKYFISIYNDRIILINDPNGWEVLTIFSDGSVGANITTVPPTLTPTPVPAG